MKWIGQHIYDYVAAFRRGVTMDSTLAVTGNTTLSGNLTFDSVALTGIQTSSESFVDDDVSVMTSAAIADKIEAYGYSTTTGDITGVDLTATTGIDITSESGTTSGNYTATIGVDVSDFMTNGSDNRILTATGADAMNAEANLTFDGTDLSCTADTVTFTSANADDPAFLIVNTTNDNQACRFRMMKDRGSAQTNNDRVGEMDFVGEDAAGNSQQYGKIMIQALEVTHGQETGKMSFQVAEYDGANTTGLSLSGQDADGEVDVTIGAGAASTTTIAGTLTTGSTAALTNAGLVAVANQSNITGLGTISSGVWNGTAIATAYIADDAVTFAKASGVSPKIYGSVIKLIPSDFMDNGDGGNQKFGVAYTDVAGTGYGMRPPNNATELYAFVSIPEGMKATHVDIYDKNDLAIEVFEVQINATTMTSKGSGNCNTTLDITDVNSTATNFLAIEVTTTSVNDRVYGGTVTIAAQ